MKGRGSERAVAEQRGFGEENVERGSVERYGVYPDRVERHPFSR